MRAFAAAATQATAFACTFAKHYEIKDLFDISDDTVRLPGQLFMPVIQTNTNRDMICRDFREYAQYSVTRVWCVGDTILSEESLLATPIDHP